jgi:uncharacterized protein (DUF1800 family)
MELFVLGVNDLNGNPNYSQTDVQEIARALTGFVIQDDEGVFDPARHDNGSKTRIDEVTGPFIAGGFVIADLLRAIFLHDDFYSDEAKSQSVKNPCEFAFSAIRATRASTNGKPLPAHLANMGMDLFDPPTVNGWNNGLAWLSSGQFLGRFEFAQTLAAGRAGDLKMSPARLFDRSAITAGAVVDDLLSKLGIAAQVPPDARQALVDYFEGATNFYDPTVIEKKVRGAIALMLDLPEFQIH